LENDIMAWDPEQYLKFAQPRLRPAVDLLSRIALDAPRTVYDVGCGAGNVTRLLAARWPDAVITGVDDSAAMLEEAARIPSRILWREQSLREWAPDAPPDLIYSNAALHWLPDHATLFPRFMHMLTPRGVLAAQMPRNWAAPSHTLVADTVHGGPWRDKLQHLLRPGPVKEPHFYYRLLAPHASSVDIWECEYLQTLRGDDPIKEFVKGSYLKQFLDALEAPERAAFEDQYAMRVHEAYPPEADGTTLFPFRRLFLIVAKA
jgi:trans-aconitate 2-methyltransferase